MAKLDDVFAEVGFDHLQPGRFKGRIQLDFLGGHRLALDDLARAGFPGDAQNIFAGLGRIAGDEDLAAVGFELVLKLDQQLVEVGQGFFLDAPGGVALGVVGGKFGARMRDVIEMTAGGVLELAAQIGIGDALDGSPRRNRGKSWPRLPRTLRHTRVMRRSV